MGAGGAQGVRGGEVGVEPRRSLAMNAVTTPLWPTHLVVPLLLVFSASSSVLYVSCLKSVSDMIMRRSAMKAITPKMSTMPAMFSTSPSPDILVFG